jgi:hypothetical protein
MRKKAQANLIQYVLTILFSVIVLVSVSSLFYTFYINSLKNEVREALTQLAVQTSDSIVTIYNDAKSTKYTPSNYTTILIREVDMKYPSAISNRNYEIFLVSASQVWASINILPIGGKNITMVPKTSGIKVIAKTTQDPKITVEYNVPNVDVGVMGTCKNGINSNLKYYRYNINGTTYDIIVLSEAGILARISGVR